MRNFNRIVMLLACLCGCVAAVQAQTVQDVLRQAREAWTANEHLSMDVEVRVFETAASTQGNLLGTALLRKSGENYYSKFLGNELISTVHSTVIIDHTARQISYLPEEGGKRRKKDQFIPQLDSIAAMQDSLVYRGLVGTAHQLEVFHKTGYITRTTYALSATTFLPERITYFYADATVEDDPGAYKSELVYKNISFDVVKTDLFSEKKYIVRKGETVRPAPAYATYRIVAAQPLKQ